MADTEEYFPRGGKKPTTIFKQSANFLGEPEKGDKKKNKSKKKSEGDDGYLSDEATREIDKSTRNCTVGLSYQTIKEGVLVLGRVRSVYETRMIVMLPCRLIGNVMACHISEPYNKQLEAYVNDKVDKVCELTKMFRPGQYIAVKVLEQNEKNLMLSTMPQHVNGGKPASDLVKGALFQAAVSSVEDHGYVMDLGVPNTTTFLPKKDVNPDIELDVGMVTWCVVKSVTPSPSSSVVTVSTTLGAIQGAVLKKKPAGTIQPGTNVEFTVETPLENGIEGKIFGDTTCYIQRQHVDKVRGKKPTLGQKIRGRVLYVLPTRNCPFLTMKSIFETTHPDLAEEQTLQEGDIVEDAQVLNIIGRTVHFKLGGGALGLLSLRRVPVDEQLADEEVLAKSYPVGSKHKVRVLCYNLSDYVYSLSDQAGVLAERYFSLRQLTPGQRVRARVRQLQDRHVELELGRLRGIVPHTHLTDGGVFIDPKKARISNLTQKYKVGEEVLARVLVVDPGRQQLVLTLKPSLLAEDLQVLASYEDARVGAAYTGTVRYIGQDYLLVSFFNNVVAYVPRNFITQDKQQSIPDAFHLGQIVKCTIISIKLETKKMSGSLTTAPFVNDENRQKVSKRKKNDSESESSPKKQKTDEQTDKKRKTDEQTDKKKKKRKEENEQTDVIGKKKKKHDSETSIDEYINSYPESQKDDKSSESDQIETDLNEDEFLTPHEQGLLDMSDCTTIKQFKKRLVSLGKAVDARNRRSEVVAEKITNIEDKGLNSKNKKYHTAMQNEKLMIEERIKKLSEAKEVVLEKLKELGYVKNENYKEEQKKRKLEKKLAKKLQKENPEIEEIKKDTVNKRNETQIDKANIQVVESLQPALDVPSAKDFFFGDAPAITNNTVAEESSSSDEETEEQPKKKRKKLSVAEKLAKVRLEEERVRAAEAAATAGGVPRSVEQFERALLADPTSSQLWIAYMAFHLQSSELELARRVARRALAGLPFRAEHDKLNVWLALLHLEHRFGTKESQQKTLEEALQLNDPYSVHSALLNIYVETSKLPELSSLIELMLRKYKRRPGLHAAAGAAAYRAGLHERARQVMQKAVAVLEKKEHVSVLMQFALLERKYGGRERAEAICEQLLAVYPQRVDVCAAYVDMLVKDGDGEQARQVMERMTSLQLPARKMKILYKKWIEIEEKIGDEAQVENIRQKAMEFIEKAKF